MPGRRRVHYRAQSRRRISASEVAAAMTEITLAERRRVVGGERGVASMWVDRIAGL